MPRPHRDLSGTGLAPDPSLPDGLRSASSRVVACRFVRDAPGAMPHGAARRLAGVKNLADVGRRFAGDDGSPDPEVRAALAGVRDTDTYLAAVAALCTARLLVPIVATGDENTVVSGTPLSKEVPQPDREAEMAAVSIVGADGRRALLAFTGMDSLRAWDAGARPVPGTLDEVAATVPEAGSDVLVVDVAGPMPLELDAALIEPLSQGHRLVELPDGGFGWLQRRA